MEYIKEDQILLDEELCGKPYDENDLRVKATIRFRENVKLVGFVLNKFTKPVDPASDLEDLYQEGCAALWEASLRYDEDSGNAFSTYAVPWIKGKIMTYLRDSEQIGTPRSWKDIKAACLRHGFDIPLDDKSIEVLVSEGKFTEEQLKNFTDISIYSIDASASNEDDIPLKNIIPGILDMANDLSEDELEIAINKTLYYIKGMKETHRELVEEWMYASLEGVKIEQKILGMKYNISQCHVSRILNRASTIFRANKESISKYFGM